jgi:hypothetical protein
MRVTPAPIDFNFQDRDLQNTVNTAANSACNCTSVATYMLVLIAEFKELIQTHYISYILFMS